MERAYPFVLPARNVDLIKVDDVTEISHQGVIHEDNDTAVAVLCTADWNKGPNDEYNALASQRFSGWLIAYTLDYLISGTYHNLSQLKNNIINSASWEIRSERIPEAKAVLSFCYADYHNNQLGIMSSGVGPSGLVVKSNGEIEEINNFHSAAKLAVSYSTNRYVQRNESSLLTFKLNEIKAVVLGQGNGHERFFKYEERRQRYSKISANQIRMEMLSFPTDLEYDLCSISVIKNQNGKRRR